MSKNIIIVGAGIAGLMCAQRLTKSGLSVSIFDKSRGVGGRIGTRRIENGIFNHGASQIPNFRKQAKIPAFVKDYFEKAISERILVPDGKSFTAFSSMKTLTSDLSLGIDIKKEIEIVGLKNKKVGIELLLGNNPHSLLHENILIFAIPQPQLVSLLKNDFQEISKLIEPAEMSASITGLFAFKEPLDQIKGGLENNNIIARHENSRLGQDLKLDCWTVHSKKVYGQNWCHLNKEEIKNRLLDDFKQLDFKNFSKPVYAAGHRWRYGFTKRSLNTDYIYDENNKIGVCGDWCKGNTVIDAAISGVSLAEKILSLVIE